MVDGKVLVIGLDGATWDLIKPWASEGKLPNLKRLMSEGTYGTMKSTTPPITIPAIPSFMTGKNPGKHGAICFVRPKMDRSLGLIDTTRIMDEFYLLPETEDMNKMVIGLLLTYPAKKINGCMITGPLTPNKGSEGFVYPHSLRKEIAPVLDNYMIDMDVDYFPGKEKEYLDDLVKMVEMRTNLVEYMLRNREWDLAIVYFIALDRVQHFFMGNDDNNWVFQAYSKIDSSLGRLLNCVSQDTNLFLFSDHGFGEIKGKFCVNAWLKENGFLVQNRKRRLPIGPQWLRVIAENPRLRFLRKLIPNWLLKHANMFWQSQDWSRGYASIDWPKTKAFATISGIHINSQQFAKDYGQIREDIIHQLKDLKHPRTGQKLGVKVLTKEELYAGPYLDKLPDILFSVEDYAYEPSATFEDVPYLLPHKVPRGWHREEAIFLAHGNNIRKGREIEECAIIDIAPTILHLMGVPIPTDIDGRVLKEIFKKGSDAARREIVYQAAEEVAALKLDPRSKEERIRNRIRELRRQGRA